MNRNIQKAAAGRRANRIYHFLLVILIIAVPLAGALRATVVERLAFADLIKYGDVIIEGKVVKSEAVRDRRGAIATTITMEVTKSLRGAPASGNFEFTIPGGELDGMGLVIAGVPKFNINDEMILFLAGESPRGTRFPVGLGQGKFNIQRDPKTGAKLLSRELAGLDVVDPKTGKPASFGADSAWDYDTTISKIEKQIRESDAAASRKGK